MSDWKLFIDDERNPPDDSWSVCRTNEEAVALIERDGMPRLVSFDHDLGRDDTGPRTTMELVVWMSIYHFNEGPPQYTVHSANPVGCQNLISFLESWKKAKDLP